MPPSQWHDSGNIFSLRSRYEKGRKSAFRDGESFLRRQVILDQRKVHFDEETCARKEINDVRIGKSYSCSSNDLNRYEIYVDPEEYDGFGTNLFLEKKAPFFRPGIGSQVTNILQGHAVFSAELSK